MKRSTEREISSAAVVMSFDFEMRWGVHDIYGLDIDGYRQNLENCRPAVLSMLSLLAERNLHATWATVGALGMNDWSDYFTCAPPPPAYANQNLAVRKEYADIDPEGTLHFAPDLVRQILRTKGQELGSHSFSHLYFREPGVTLGDFLADMSVMEREWKSRFGITPVSLVYPRNQSAFIDQVQKTSIKMWRGSEPSWFYDCTSKRRNTMLPRVLRFVDSLNPWVQRAAQCENGMVRASLFLRIGLPEALWKLQIRRVKNELNCLEPGHIFHLWWHPHNVGIELKKGVSRIAQVLDLIAEACTTRKIISMSMKGCQSDYMRVGEG